MLKEITMPAGGQTTDTSVVGSWLVKKGDRVERGDALLEIETDKATLTVESFAQGVVLEILAEAGEEVAAGEIIAYIGEEKDNEELQKRMTEARQIIPKGQFLFLEEEEEEYQPIDKTRPPIKKEKSKEDTGGGEEFKLTEIQAMPNAKRKAKEEGILLSDVSEYAGKKILKRQDVQEYISHKEKDKDACQITLTGMRKTIAKRMLESVQNIPTFQATVEVEMRKCVEFRKLVNEQSDPIKVSYNDILFKCIEAAIRKYPYINASFTEEAIVIHQDINIGLAVSVEEGLLVPVVHKIQEKTISEIAGRNRDNIKRARENQLTSTEMSGGTLTLSNMGMYPITQFNAIINPPEACILAVGMIEDKLILTNGEVKSIPVMKITGSFDHRVIDGAYGAQFLTELKRIVENPALALL